MPRHHPTWVVDPDDPRAPPMDVWDAMTEEERARVVAELPSEIEATEAAPPEGDAHFDAQAQAKLMLRRHFDRVGRRVYVACNLPVYYPDTRLFAPDLLGVLDVPLHPRLSWIVAREGKGIDFALEIHVAGDRRKDAVENVAFYERLGIGEYFVFDLPRSRLSGHRLEQGRYQRLVPQGGRFSSRVLDLDLAAQGDRIRFFYGEAELPDLAELATRLERMVDEAIGVREQAERALEEERRALEEERRAREEERRAREEERRAREEERRAREEEHRAREEAERRLAEALAEIERLRRG